MSEMFKDKNWISICILTGCFFMVESNILMEMRFQGITCQEKTLYFKSTNLCFKSIIIFKISILFQIHKTFFQIDIYFSNLQSFNLNPYLCLKSTKLYFKWIIIFQIYILLQTTKLFFKLTFIFQIYVYLIRIYELKVH